MLGVEATPGGFMKPKQCGFAKPRCRLWNRTAWLQKPHCSALRSHTVLSSWSHPVRPQLRAYYPRLYSKIKQTLISEIKYFIWSIYIKAENPPRQDWFHCLYPIFSWGKIGNTVSSLVTSWGGISNIVSTPVSSNGRIVNTVSTPVSSNGRIVNIVSTPVSS